MKIPKQETIVETYLRDETDDTKEYIVTRNLLGKYTLYKVKENDYEKVKTADTPIEFKKIARKDWSE
jgi:hypothetical protein